MDAFIFDFDGLLVDTEWPAFITVHEVFRAHGAEMTLEQWQARIGRGDNRPWVELLEEQVGAVDHVAINRLRQVKKNEMTEQQPLLPGVLALLDAAEQLGLAKGVASSSAIDWVGPHLEQRGIAGRFGAVLTRDQVARAKPWPDLFIAACEALSVEPTRAVAFEDSVHGVTAAKDAGLFCVAVPNRVTAGGDFTRADMVLATLEDLDLGELGLA